MNVHTFRSSDFNFENIYIEARVNGSTETFIATFYGTATVFDVTKMFSSADVAAVRHVVQRILVPCVFVIGLLGNSMSIYVLTRKRMRCTTNIYLTALAITDIIYLTMALLLSLKHYDFVQRHVEVFWKCYGYVVWLCDACAYISIYIAVCFTIERFIAIRYPLKRQTFCTESLAKKVITGVVLFCLLSTISTAFEHQYRIIKKSIDIHGNACNITKANATERLLLLPLNYSEALRQQQVQQEDEQHFAQQHYIPLPTLRSQNGYEGSGEDVMNEQTLRRWQAQHPIEAAGNINTNDEGNNNDLSDDAHVRKVKPEVMLRRLKRTVNKYPTTDTFASTTLHSPVSPPPADIATGVPLDWQPVPATIGQPVKGSSAFAMKRSLLIAADTHIPSILSNYFPLGTHRDLLLDSEFLLSATTSRSESQPSTEQTFDGTQVEPELYADDLDEEKWLPQSQAGLETNVNETAFFNVTYFCEDATYYQNSLSSLAENALYTRLWYFFTLFVFVLMPLCLLATFNCFLIMLVRRSKNLRGEMTNANSIRRSRRSGKGPHKSHSTSVSQENRITVTLIAVVLLFIVCQLPWAIYLIVSENVAIERNVQAIIGNIFNFLAAINAAANFFLYCVLSDKYRKTVRELITGYKYRTQRNTSASASLYTSTNAAHAYNGSRRYRPTASLMVVK